MESCLTLDVGHAAVKAILGFSLDTTWGTTENTAVAIPSKKELRLTRCSPAEGVSTPSSRGRPKSKFLSVEHDRAFRREGRTMHTSSRAAIALVAFICLLGIVPASEAGGPGHGPGGPGDIHPGVSQKHVPDELLVRFKAGVSPKAKASAHAGVGAYPVEKFKIVEDLELVKLPAGMKPKDAIKFYRQHPDVLYAEPNYVVEALAIPNDASFSSLWGLNNTGQSGGTPDADIDAVQAWDLTTGSSNVVVAVIDTGIDYNHPDLLANVYSNTLDCNSNGIDDDGNGYVDDCHGMDFFNNDSDPMDDNNHGTHVSGTIGAVGNNGVGVAGVNWNVRILACKFLGAGGSGSTSGAIACLNYVATMKDLGVKIIATSNSWGGGGFSQALFDAIDAHRQRGILFIAAAGNSNLDNDTSLFYPASYYLPNVISVAATTRTDARASFSNFGSHTVHLGAPGSEILSTTPGNTYSTFSGTSMATPHVTGVAALLKAQDSTRDWKTIKNLILAGGDNISSLTNTITQKRLNAYGALTCLGSTVLSRLRPVGTTITSGAGAPIDLAALHINCANANGVVTVTVNPGGQTVTLLDDGVGPDQVAGDGIYSAQWTPPAQGIYTLTFPGGDVVTVQVLTNYSYSSAPFSWRTITGTSLNLSDDSSAQISLAQISPPLSIPFGGGTFTNVFVGSNGNVNFSGPFTEYFNASIPTGTISTLVAPFWDDLYPVPGSAQNVFWAVTGAAPNRELVIEWRDVRLFSCNADSGATVKFQVVFFEGSGNILFNYADTAFGGACAFADRAGSATVGVQVASNSGNQSSINFPSVNDGTALLWTLVVPPPAISVTPTSQDFGSVAVGSSADRSFTVQNIGGGTLTGNASASTSFGIFSPPGGSFSLGAGTSQTVVVRFTPTAAGSVGGNVSFTSNGGNVSRAVTGTGTAPTGQITVTSPNGGQTWRIAKNQDIKWSSKGVTGNVKVELSRDGGLTWQIIVSSTPNDRTYKWTVTGPATAQALIRVSSVTNPFISDRSNANFTIR